MTIHIADDIRDKIDLVDLIGRDVVLRRSGHEATGLCPWHSEKSPSFRVYEDHFNCFGCGAHGDVFKYVMRQKGIEFGAEYFPKSNCCSNDLIFLCRSFLAFPLFW